MVIEFIIKRINLIYLTIFFIEYMRGSMRIYMEKVLVVSILKIFSLEKLN